MRAGSKGPVPGKRAAGVMRPDGAQASGGAHACRVVVSTPPASDSGSARGATELPLGASLVDHLRDAVAVLSGR
jgi:hypothetical protein